MIRDIDYERSTAALPTQRLNARFPPVVPTEQLAQFAPPVVTRKANQPFREMIRPACLLAIALTFLYIALHATGAHAIAIGWGGMAGTLAYALYPKRAYRQTSKVYMSMIGRRVLFLYGDEETDARGMFAAGGKSAIHGYLRERK